MTRPVPVDAIAKLFSLSPRRIQQLAALGVIPRAEGGGYDLLRSIAGYVRFLQRRAEGEGSNRAG